VGYYALIYHVVEDYVARRVSFRDEHLKLARESHGRGELLMGGAFVDPVDTALLIFRAPSGSVAENFARSDPYVINGLVSRWEVRSWSVAVGQDSFRT